MSANGRPREPHAFRRLSEALTRRAAGVCRTATVLQDGLRSPGSRSVAAGRGPPQDCCSAADHQGPPLTPKFGVPRTSAGLQQSCRMV